MIKEIDSGHIYQLLTLDGDLEQTLTFVKRFDLENPEKFPGNTNAYPGTTLQSVIRCLISRLDYLDNQIKDRNNQACINYLERCLWLLEERAARRHNYSFEYRPEDIMSMPLCPHCGHIVCTELGNVNRA